MREVRFSSVNHPKWSLLVFSLDWDLIEEASGVSNDVGLKPLRQIFLYS